MAMEQIGKYWGLWASTRSGNEPSWEEQAFARDAAAAAHLGGCVWPPRSYSCSFCQREFRSAQALGGHMNVHRRDRALLRQVSSPDDDDGQEAASGEQPKPQGPLFCRAAGSSNPSTTATGSSNTALSAAKGDVNHGTAPPPPSYLASIINESKNKRLFMPMIPASMTTREEVMGQCDDHGDGDVESGRMKRRRLLDPPLVAVSMVAASESQGIVDPDAKVTTTTIISSPRSIPPLEEQQEVDLELRLGTTPKVT